MTHRPLHVRQAMIAVGLLTFFMTTLTVMSSTPDVRVRAGLLVFGTGAVVVLLVPMIASRAQR